MRGDLFRSILQGYLRILKTVGLLGAMVGASIGLGFLVAWPLWLFATTRRAAYSYFALAAIIAVLVFLFVRRAQSRRRIPLDPSRRPRRPVLAVLLFLLRAFVLVAGAYLSAFLVIRGLYGAAIPLLLVLLALVGYFAFGTRRRTAR